MTADGVEPRVGIFCSVRLQLYEVCQGVSLRIIIIVFNLLSIASHKKLSAIHFS